MKEFVILTLIVLILASCAPKERVVDNPSVFSGGQEPKESQKIEFIKPLFADNVLREMTFLDIVQPSGAIPLAKDTPLDEFKLLYGIEIPK